MITRSTTECPLTELTDEPRPGPGRRPGPTARGGGLVRRPSQSTKRPSTPVDGLGAVRDRAQLAASDAVEALGPRIDAAMEALGPRLDAAKDALGPRIEVANARIGEA